MQKCLPAASKYLTNSKWPSWAASIKGVEHPSSISAPALIRKSATSRKPPQQARVKAVSWVSSVCALIFAPKIKILITESHQLISGISKTWS